MAFEIVQIPKKLPPVKSPIMIEGLPGIGNVGKIAVDFMVDQLKPELIYQIYSDSFPNSVFVTEKNLVELPSVKVYLKRMKGEHDVLFLAGDFQPVEERASYEFAENLVQMFNKMGGCEIITLGGIGLSQVPENPKVYCTGTDKRIVDKYAKGTSIETKLFGFVGPIIGAAGLLLGIGKKRKIPAITLLAETFAHPMYLGIKGAREMIRILNQKLSLRVDIRKIDRDMKEIERQIKNNLQADLGKQFGKPELMHKFKKLPPDMNYIG